MLKGIHFLLTYKCTYECDHCFLYCSPYSQGTFTINQILSVLKEAKAIGSVEWVYFEGGEPLLYYPLLLESIKMAKTMGFFVGLVTNCYPMQTEEDARIWLKPLADCQIDGLSVSNDEFHFEGDGTNPAEIAYNVSKELGINASIIRIEKPELPSIDCAVKGKPITEGGPRYRGRAAVNLTDGLAGKSAMEMASCPFEELTSPERVHVDSYGNVQICQGISMGNMWETKLSSLIDQYDVEKHPICGPLNTGGPLKLAQTYNIPFQENFADVCHFCFMTRRSLLKRFPQVLTPTQVYGVN